MSRLGRVIPRVLPLTLMVLAHSGCESQRFAAAREADSLDAYLHYLGRYPRGTHADQARGRLERLRFWAARRADTPLAYHRYLELHPQGAGAPAARRRLATIALKRASTAAQLELVIERHPQTPQARQAERRLPAALAREVLQSNDRLAAERFLARFPSASQTEAVREHLARLEYAGLSDREPPLEAFLARHGSSSVAQRALARLERLLARRVLETLSETDLARYRVRFSRHANLARLEQAVAQARLRRAIVALDLTRLRSAQDPTATKLVARCRRRPAVCEQLRQLAATAAPWRPRRSLAELRQAVYAPDPQQAWQALVELSWTQQTAAASAILPMAASERLSMVWVAMPALRRWVERGSRARVQGWLRAQLARRFHRANADERQLRAILQLLAGEQRAEDGLAALRRLVRQPDRTLAVAHLLAYWEHRLFKRAPTAATLARLRAAARARLSWLQNALPAEVHQDSLASVVLLERELFALHRSLAAARSWSQGQPVPGLVAVSVDVETALQGLRQRLKRAAAGAELEQAHLPQLEPAVMAHEAQRENALRRLRGRGWIGEQVARALCDGGWIQGRKCPESVVPH